MADKGKPVFIHDVSDIDLTDPAQRDALAQKIHDALTAAATAGSGEGNT